MWTQAVDIDSLVRFLNRNVLTLEKLAAVIDSEEEPDDDLMLELVSKIHQSLAGMVSYLKLRKENESDQLEAVEAPARDREVASGHRQDLAGRDHLRGAEGELEQLRRGALRSATHRNYGKRRQSRRRAPRRTRG